MPVCISAVTYPLQQIEMSLLCPCHKDDDAILLSNTFSEFVMGNSNCYVLNLNVIPLRSVPAILLNTSMGV
jgi:hypothetical protein